MATYSVCGNCDTQIGGLAFFCPGCGIRIRNEIPAEIGQDHALQNALLRQMIGSYFDIPVEEVAICGDEYHAWMVLFRTKIYFCSQCGEGLRAHRA